MNVYGICHSIASFMTYYIFKHYFLDNFKHIQNYWDTIALGLLLSCIFGARLMSLLQNDIKRASFMSIHQGGISGFGAYYLGLSFLIVIAHIFDENKLKLIESMALSSSFYMVLIRFGNYYKGELYGRYSNYLGKRHPSQLYQLITEGLLISLLLWSQKHTLGQGFILSLLGVSLGTCRFICEFFKENEGGIPNWYNGYVKYIKWAQFQAILFINVMHLMSYI